MDPLRKTRSDAKLPKGDAFSDDWRQLCDWLATPGLSLKQIVELCAKPREEGGLGIQTGTRALSVFWRSEAPIYLRARRADAKVAADSVVADARKSPAQWDEATIELLRQQAYSLAQNPAVDPREVKAVFGLVLKARDQDIQRERFTQQVKSDMDKGLDALFAEIKGNAEAEALFARLKAAVVRSVEGGGK